MKTFKCLCGEKEHTVGDTTLEGKMLIGFIEKLGEVIKVTSLLSGKTYLVPRIYIAVHGLSGDKLDYLALQYELEEVV